MAPHNLTSASHIAVAYLRASTEDQALSGDAQRAAILAFCAKRGLSVASFHDDHGVSGATTLDKRPAFLEALSALKQAGKGAVLVVAKRDRLARSVLIAATAESLVARLGCTIESADGAGAGNGPEADLMRTLLDAFAQFERALICARTRAALAVRKSKGLRISGSAPFGFTFDGPRVIPCPSEQATVARAGELRAAHPEWSVRRIVRNLRAEGYQGRAGKPVTYRVIAS